METNDQNEVWVGVKVDLAVGRVLHLHAKDRIHDAQTNRGETAHTRTTTHTYLLEQQPVVAEDSQRRPGVVTRYVELLAAADLHGKHVALRKNYSFTLTGKMTAMFRNSATRLVDGTWTVFPLQLPGGHSRRR